MSYWQRCLLLILTLLQTVHVIVSQVLARLDISVIADSIRGGLSAIIEVWQELLVLLRS